MTGFTVTCTKCGKQKLRNHPTRATFSCQSCGSKRGKISFPPDVEVNSLIFRCQKCEGTFLVRSGEEALFQCISVKCGGFILDTIETLVLSNISHVNEISGSDFTFTSQGSPFRIPSSKRSQASLKVVIPYFDGGTRIRRAVTSWVYPEVVFALTDKGIIPPGYGVSSQFFTDKNSKSEKIGNKTKPFLIDLLSKLVRLFPNEEYYGLFNSDIILPPGVSIKSLLPSEGNKIVFHHRLELEGKDHDHVLSLKIKQQTHSGKDGFIGDKEAVREIISEVKDMILGAAGWDSGLNIWCFRKYGKDKVELRYGEIAHSVHKQDWNSGDPETVFNHKQLDSMGITMSVCRSFNWFKIGSKESEELQMKRLNPLGIIQPGRIGDIIIVLPIAKWYHDRGYKIFWPVATEYLPLFDYVNYVEPIDIGSGFGWSYKRSKEKLAERNVTEIIDLGIGFGKDESEWTASGLSFDEWKYKEAGVPFDERFNLSINRNFPKELELEKQLNISKDLVLTHSVGSKGSVDFGQRGAIEITPIAGFTVFDWIGVIEKAKKVYCVDSCISHLVNQLGLAKGRRVFSPFPLKDYGGRTLVMAVPKINWKDEGVPSTTTSIRRKLITHSNKSNGILLVSLPGLNTGNWPIYPLGVGYLHTSLKKDRKTHSIHFQKQSHADGSFPKLLSELKPHFVGFTCTSFNRGNVRRGIKTVRAISPESKVILGGVHPTFLPDQMLKNYGADYVVMGEGENTVRDLCKTTDENGDLSKIDGIAYKDEQGKICINPSITHTIDLDSFSHPNFSYAEQMIRDSKMGSIISSRGCPVSCNYCSTSHYWGQKIRIHSVNWVLDEIERQISIYGIEKLFFHDDTFNLSEERVKDICQGMIDRKFNISWAVSNRVVPISREMLDAMVEAGCRHICFGIESGSKTMLKAMNKKINLEQIRKAYDLCTKYKDVLTTGAFTMVGYPGENDQTVKETYEFLNTIPMTDSPSTSILYVLPGTEVCKQLKIDDKYWVDTDDVFYNTVENPMLTLQKWANIINRSGKKISFDSNSHFWNNILFGKVPDPKPPNIDFKSELDNIIPPEIKDDEFYQLIMKLSREEDVHNVLEIGSSSGDGSTSAFVEGLRHNPNNPTIYCMELSKTRFGALQNRYASDRFVKCYNVSSVSLEKFPSEKKVSEFYRTTKTALNDYPLEKVLGWLRQDKEYIDQYGILSDGISMIRKENNINNFDMVLIDGSEFTGESELNEVYGADIILLDDTNGFKNRRNLDTLRKSSGYTIIAENSKVRNGYAVFRRTKMPPPLHFFTIVLNGMPFIKYHIKMLESLPFDWHWHIVEGVGDLKYDTAWSIQTGGKITEKLHKNGLSIDGTTEYIDSLKKNFPDKVSVYRKEPGEFWDGKVEMVNAPIPYLPDECLLWQVDVDEFWDSQGISKMVQMFEIYKDKMSAFVYCHYFVGPTKLVTSINTWGTLPEDWLRVFRFHKGMYWERHEPPTLIDKDYTDWGRKNPISRNDTLKEGITFQHFAYVLPEQVLFKEVYYGYKDAVKYWRTLQKMNGSKIDVSVCLPWARRALVENWNENKHGKLLYPGEWMNESY